MRIIAGEARGRTILAPKGQDTRPTQDYIRESLFNILMRDTPDALVLDLFAGSGALALEAISRGAKSAVAVDCATEAINCIRQNTAALGFDDRVTVQKSDWKTALQRMSDESRRFSLVFLDPPYRMTDTGAQCNRMADLGLLCDGALMVIEHRKGETTAPDERFSLRDSRKYGDTVIDFYRYQGGASQNA